MEDSAERVILFLFKTDLDLSSGETFLKRHTGARVVRSRTATSDQPAAADVIRVRNASQLRTLISSSRLRPKPSSFHVGLAADFDLHRQRMSGLASIRLRPMDILSSGRDQIFVLDREQRIVAFFGRWPKQSPRRIGDMFGKRKRELFGPEIAELHEAAGRRALDGEEVSYEWSITDLPRPVHLFTTASPLRNDDGEVAGVLLVTRDVTQLRESLRQIERELHAMEQGIRRIGAVLHPSGTSELGTPALPRGAALSRREDQILQLLRRGARLRSIAETLGISVETVRRHVKGMFRKTGVHSQEALVNAFGSGRE